MRFPLRNFRIKNTRWPVLALLLAISLWLGAKAGGDGLLYKRTVSPYGIISLELAGDREKAMVITDYWGRWRGRKIALESLYYDYFFMFFYSITLALACLMASDTFYSLGGTADVDGEKPGLRPGSKPGLWSRIGRVGVFVAWGQFVAALFDAIENIGLQNILKDNFTFPYFGLEWPAIVRICAELKFGLILLGIAYIISGVIIFQIAGLRLHKAEEKEPGNLFSERSA